MKQALLISIAVFSLAAQAKPDRSFTREDRTRFLFTAVLEGLLEDDADAKMVEGLTKDPWKLFIPKCPICMPVMEGTKAYVAAVRSMVWPATGKGLPADLAANLQSADRKVQLKALETLVDRYVTRKFDRTVMTEGEKSQMKNLLLMGKKEGMTLKEQKFGDYCPSCNGATLR